MTCIVAIKKDNKVYMGGDSALVDNNAGIKVKIATPKVFDCFSYIIGYAGSARMGQLLFNYFQPSDPPRNPYELEMHMVTTFVDELRALAEEKGLRLDTGSEEMNDFASILVGINGRIFVIEPDWQASEWLCDYAAIGSGMELAIGSLYTTNKLKVKPEERIKLALETASEHSTSVCEPFHTVTREW